MKSEKKDAGREAPDAGKNVGKNGFDCGKKKNTNDERTLLKLLREGDADGLEHIMLKYHARLFSVANKICRNPADAEEVLQDVYWTAFSKIDRFQERSSLATWLHRIAVNTSLVKIRSQKMYRNTCSMETLTCLPGEEENALRLTEEAKSPAEYLMSKELYKKIRESVEKLPSIYQDVFFLRDIQGFSIQETSQLLQTTSAAIKSRSCRSRIFLKKNLGHYLHEN